ncbi:rCG26670 [Rattus norvegicus]|uniref:RCG26670 n=1 Tax=Rattus norvegicus TaxID=10116 RepID=A6HM76_RAT|nr:rCG26670 [Rattus norvegicus]
MQRMKGSNYGIHRSSERNKGRWAQTALVLEGATCSEVLFFLVITPCANLSENTAEMDLRDRSYVAATQLKPKPNIHRGFLLFLTQCLPFQNRI